MWIGCRLKESDGGAVLAEAGGRLVRGGRLAVGVVVVSSDRGVDLASEVFRVPRALGVRIRMLSSPGASPARPKARCVLPRPPMFVVFIFSIVRRTCPMLKTLHVYLSWDLNYL